MPESPPSSTPAVAQRPPPPSMNWMAGACAGVTAGVVFLIVEMLLVWLAMGMSPWAPPRMMAAILLGPSILPPPADFSLLAMATALAVHLPLSALYGLVIGWLVRRCDMGMAVLVGLVSGLVIYGVNFYVIAPVMFPWFVEARNWIGVLGHAIFGMVAGGAYVHLNRGRA